MIGDDEEEKSVIGKKLWKPEKNYMKKLEAKSLYQLAFFCV